MDTSRSFDDLPETMTTDQVGELLGHPASVVQMWARDGKIPAYKASGSQRWWFDRDQVIDWVRAHRVVPESPNEE